MVTERCEKCGTPAHRPERDEEYQGIPEHLRDGLRYYIEKHIPVGHFLTGVLASDLSVTVGHADPISKANLADIVIWLWNEAPSDCWGSPQAVTAWISKGE